jgi:hypothetical protein
MGVSISSHKGAANWRIAAGGRWQSMIKPKARCDQLLSEILKKEINCMKQIK